MLGPFRTSPRTAPLIFLCSVLLSIADFGVKIKNIAYARAMDTDHTDDVQSGLGKQSETSNDFFENASTLEEVWSHLKQLVPNRGTNGYIQPEAVIVEDFERIVVDMFMTGQRSLSEESEKECLDRDDCSLEDHSGTLSPSCDSIDLRSLKGKYEIRTFVDRENERSYCVLATTSILYPWGNVIVDLDASSATKNLSFDCPHPKFDAETGEQGIRLLKGTRARSWIVSGSHRMANNDSFGTCQAHHYTSDAAHSVNNCFLAAVAAVKFYYETVVFQDYTSVQLHGMAKGSCGSIDTFFSHGSCSEKLEVTGDEKIDILQRIAKVYPTDNGKHAVAGRDGGTCHLCGSNNIQGRLINGVARKNLCEMSASTYSGRFIQIEQKQEYRREAFAPFWVDVFNEAYPQFLALYNTPNAQPEESISKTKDCVTQVRSALPPYP